MLVVTDLTPKAAERLVGARAVVALVEVQHDLEALGQLLVNPGEAAAQGGGVHDREDSHVLPTELLTLLLVGLAVPGGDEGVHTGRCRD